MADLAHLADDELADVLCIVDTNFPVSLVPTSAGEKRTRTLLLRDRSLCCIRMTLWE